MPRFDSDGPLKSEVSHLKILRIFDFQAVDPKLFSLGQSWTLKLISTTTHHNHPSGTFRPLLCKLEGWDLTCWLYSQMEEQPRCFGRMVIVTNPRIVTIQLHSFLPYVNLALNISYQTGIGHSKLIARRNFGHQKFLPRRNLDLRYHYQTS